MFHLNSIRINKNIKEILIVLIIFLSLSSLFFWKIILFPDKMISFPGSYSAPWYDPRINVQDVFLFHEFMFSVFRSISEYGQFPLWNPYLFSGTPMIGNPFYQIFYPINILFLLVPVDLAFGYIYIIHVFIAGISTYLFTRCLNLDKFSSMVSGIVFMLNGFIILHISAGHFLLVSSFVWTPLLFLFVELVFKKKTLFYALLLSVTLTLQFLSDTEFFIYTNLILLFYFLFRLFFVFRDEGSFKNIFKITALIVSSFIVFLLLSSVHLLPLIQHYKHSNRSGGVSYAFATSHSLPPEQVILFVMPEFFGTHLDDSYWGKSELWELWGYAGILPLILTTIAAIFKRNRYTIFFLLLAAFSVLYALGRYTPLFSFFFYLIPLFNTFRVQPKILLFYMFSISVLAGFGINFLINKIKGADRKPILNLIKILIVVSLLGIGTAGFVYFSKDYILDFGKEIFERRYQEVVSSGGPLLHSHEYYLSKIDAAYSHLLSSTFIFNLLLIFSISLLYLRLRKKMDIGYIKMLILLIILFDLFLFNMKYIDVIEPGKALPKNDVIELLEEDDDTYRVFDMNETSTIWQGSRYGIEEVWFYTGLRLGYYNEFIYIVGNCSSENVDEPRPIETIYYPKLIDLLNTKYIITGSELESDRFELVYNKTVLVYQNKQYLPRAFIVRNAKVIEDKENIFDELRKEEFDPREYIILEKEVDEEILNNGGEFKEADVIYRSPNRIIVNVSLDAPGFLVLSEIWYPGWKAYDDGEEIEIYKTDYVLRSVYLKEGEHSVEFSFEPDSLKLGSYITFITIICLILGIVIRHSRLSMFKGLVPK